MKKASKLLRTTFVLIILGFILDGFVDTMSLCHQDATQACTAVCHTGSCQFHFYPGSAVNVASVNPKQVPTFVAVQVLIPSPLVHKIFNPPKTQA